MGGYISQYVKAAAKGLLNDKIREAADVSAECTLCPWQCRVNRLKGEKGFCTTGKSARIYSWSSHFGEEPPLVGSHGSGTIFFSNCNLKCIFCQNYDISIEGAGQDADDSQIAAVMLDLQNSGCHNINLVTPSHVVPNILGALKIAAEKGLNIPLIYNCSGYESVETLKILKGVVDIYMPDFKFWSPEAAGKYCNAPDYPDAVRAAVKEMHDQVGELKVDSRGIAYSGLLVRHLVMPGHLEETREILQFLQKKVSPATHVNLMSQYRPMGLADKVEKISRPLTAGEFSRAMDIMKKTGLILVR